MKVQPRRQVDGNAQYEIECCQRGKPHIGSLTKARPTTLHGSERMVNKSKIEDILERLRRGQQKLEEELESLVAEKGDEFQYPIRRGKVVFERSIRRFQRSQRVGLWRYLRDAPRAYVLSAPVIYGMVVLLVIKLSSIKTRSSNTTTT